MQSTTLASRRLLQTATLLIAASISGCLFAGGDETSHTLPAVSNAKWQAECSSCHGLYHPALLPERTARLHGLCAGFIELSILGEAMR